MSTARFGITKDALGNAGVLAFLAAIAAWLVSTQTQAWSLTSDASRWLAAGAALLGYSAFIASIGVRRRRANARVSASAADALSVWFASQTGVGEQWALRTATTLCDAGLPSHAVSLARLDRDALSKATRLLFVVSTTGEGDAPDNAARFVRELMSSEVSLPNLRYGILALGDREYANFCAFGHRLDAWLRHCGAQPLFDLVEVDNGDEGALRHWQHHLGQISGAADLPDWQAPSYSAWTLSQRRHLNPGSVGGAVFHIELQPVNPAEMQWKAGDIAEIGPRNSVAAVQEFLDAAGLVGAMQIDRDETLETRLSRCRLPTAESIRGREIPEWVATLAALPHREYSIASIPADGALHLLVRQLRRPDGTLGLGAGWLTQYAPLGARIDVRLRANPSFRLDDDARPLILVGNGSGIAGLRALLRERIDRQRHRNWLLFGERNAAHDAFYGDELSRWLVEGKLARVDYAWSRDSAARPYVQHRLREAANELQQWIDDGASIYVCGSLEGMAPGVDAVLRETLGDERVDALLDAGRYRRDVY
jgi:sulfite reductase (NADPH) flavoprotein alpha-component